MSLVTSAIGILTPADVRRDPHEELRLMMLREPVRGMLLQSLTPGGTLIDQRAEDPYENSPGAVGRIFTVLRASPYEIILLQIPDWIANDGRSVGALDEMRYAFRGRTVRIISQGVHAPSLGLETLLDFWKANEKIDAAFVPWRRVEELAAGRHGLLDVLHVAALPASALPAAEPPATPPTPPAATATGTPPPAGPKVFISYAHNNRDWYEKLMTMLAPLTDKYGEAIWSDNQLEAGDDWMTKIVEALNASPIVVLLVGPYFTASKFIKAHEFGVALKEAKAGTKRLIWVYVTTCRYADVGIGAFQAAHDIQKPLDRLPEGEQWEQLAKVYDSLAKALEKLG